MQRLLIPNPKKRAPGLIALTLLMTATLTAVPTPTASAVTFPGFPLTWDPSHIDFGQRSRGPDGT